MIFKIAFFLLFTLSLMASPINCGSRCTLYNAPSTAQTLNIQNSAEVSGKVHFNDMGAIKSDLCRNDYYKLLFVKAGDYNITVVPNANKKIKFFLASDCNKANSNNADIYHAEVSDTLTITKHFDADKTICMRIKAIKNQGCTGYSVAIQKNQTGPETLTVSFVDPSYNVPEGAHIDIPIRLSQPAPRDLNVSFATEDGTANESDYVPNSGIVHFSQGEQEKNITVYVKQDNLLELEEFFKIKLSHPSSGLQLGTYPSTTIIIPEQSNPPLCFADNFDETFLQKYWRTLKSSGNFDPYIENNRFRLTSRGHNIATAMTADYAFRAAYNIIKIEFDHYAWGGCEEGINMGEYGADGMALVLFDSQVGPSPDPGAYGGGLGYTQADYHFSDADPSEHSQPGFEKGWLGIGIDEYGTFIRGNEGRFGGIWGQEQGYGDDCELVPNNITIRGASGDLTGEDDCGRDCDAKPGQEARCCGYRYLTSSAQKPKDARNIECRQKTEINKYMQLHPPIADKHSTSPKPGDHYVITIDSRDPNHLYLRVERGDTVIIDRFDAKAAKYRQPAIPEYVRLALTAGTGGGCNNHEIDNIKVYGVCHPYNPDNNASFIVTEDEEAQHILDLQNWIDVSKERNLTTKIAPMHKRYCILAADENDPESPSLADHNVSVIYKNDFGVSIPVIQTATIPAAKSYCFWFDYDKAAKKGWFEVRDNDTGSTSQSDPFSIRPQRYVITSNTPLDALHAGRTYYLTIKAVGSDAAPIADYNQTNLALQPNTTLYYADDTPCVGCNDLHGDLSAFTQSFSFQNGVTTNGSSTQVADIAFNDVGRVRLSIIDTSWASIDSADSEQSCLGAWICGEINATFIPDHFDVTIAKLANFKDGSFTYFANDPLQMGAAVETRLVAKGADANTTKNFTQGERYYERPLKLLLTVGSSPTTSTPVIHDINTSRILGFNQGELTIEWNETNQSKQLRFNFARQITQALVPFTLNGSSVALKAQAFYGSQEINGSATGSAADTLLFLYGCIHAPLYKRAGNMIASKIFYEYYDPAVTAPAAIRGDESLDDIGWYINKKHTDPAMGKIYQIRFNNIDILSSNPYFDTVAQNITNGIQTLRIRYKKEHYPFHALFDINASSWLLYNRFDATAQYVPMEIIFEGKGRWKGIGRFKTQKEFNQSEIPFNRIQW